MLQVNTTLRTLEIDDNAISLVGFQLIRDGLMRNSSLQQMTIPVFDAVSIKKRRLTHTASSGTLNKGQQAGAVSGLTTFSNLIKDIESKVYIFFHCVVCLFQKKKKKKKVISKLCSSKITYTKRWKRF